MNELMSLFAGSVIDKERRIKGVVPGIVIDHTDRSNQARVRVKVPSLGCQELWARVAVPLAGKGRGLLAIPQVGDEVLLGFNHGNPAEPFVVGSLWNDKDEPPLTPPGDTSKKVILRTSGGHVLQFDDEAGSVEITLATGHQVSLRKDDVRVLAKATKDSSTSSGELRISKDGTITIEGKSIVIKATNAISIEGATIELKAKGTTTIDADGVCSISGKTVRIN